jgi:autotransporter-associated beta strand protein
VPVTINLNGGAITAGSFTKFQTVAGRETFLNLNGGTIRAGASNANFLPALTGLIANVQTGGAKFDTNGFDVTVTQPLTHDPALDVTPDGGLTKLGVGTLTITAANTYTGATTVTAGTLEFTTSQTLTSLVIAAGAEVRLAPSAPGALADFSTTASADDEQSAFDKPSQSLAAGGSVQAVPEPGTLGLLIIGALSLLGRRRAVR